MEQAQLAEARPYHHGDLRRALVEAGRRLLEAEGGSDLSLRAVAREAGVSPAAPYHHFRDKSELLDALALQGWDQLGEEMQAALSEAEPGQNRLVTLGVAYVRFCRMNPAIYRVMFACSQNHETMPEKLRDDGAYRLVCDTLVESGLDPEDETRLELAGETTGDRAHTCCAQQSRCRPCGGVCGKSLPARRAFGDQVRATVGDQTGRPLERGRRPQGPGNRRPDHGYGRRGRCAAVRPGPPRS